MGTRNGDESTLRWLTSTLAIFVLLHGHPLFLAEIKPNILPATQCTAAPLRLWPPRALCTLHHLQSPIRPPTQPLHLSTARPQLTTSHNPRRAPTQRLTQRQRRPPSGTRETPRAARLPRRPHDARPVNASLPHPPLPFAQRPITPRSFGQRAMQTCAHCTTQADYALHALPPALLSYTLAAVVLGATTARGTARESRRAVGLIVLVVGALAEAYWAYTVPISIASAARRSATPPDVIMVRTHPVLCSPFCVVLFFQWGHYGTVARYALVPPSCALPCTTTSTAPPPSPTCATSTPAHAAAHRARRRRAPRARAPPAPRDGEHAARTGTP